MTTTFSWLALVFFEPDEIRKFRALLPLTNDEAAIFTQCLGHHMLGARAYRVLGEANRLELLPHPAREALFRAYLSSVNTHEIFGLELQRLERGLDGLAWVPAKGLALAKKVYPSVYDRPFSDLDLLFRKIDRERISQRLELLGYRELPVSGRFSANLHKRDFIHRDNAGLRLEAHFGLGPRFTEFSDDELIAAFSASAVMPIEYVFLLFHGFVQHRMQKAVWLLDLVQIRKLTLNPEKYGLFAAGLGLSSVMTIAEHWLGALRLHLEQGKACDSYLEDILLARVDQNLAKTLCLRAHLMGGWSKLIRYAWAREWALRA